MSCLLCICSKQSFARSENPPDANYPVPLATHENPVRTVTVAKVGHSKLAILVNVSFPAMDCQSVQVASFFLPLISWAWL